MDIRDYQERKDKGFVEMKGIGNNRVNIEIAQFNTGTGERLPSDFETVNADPDGIAKAIKNAEEQLETAKKYLADMKAFYADVTAANDEWEGNKAKGAEILGKKTKAEK